MSHKIAICHYRVGGTDGVSLQIDERKKLLKDMGFEVKLVSGPTQKGADWVIDDLEFDEERILQIRRYAFENSNDFPSDEAFLRRLGEVSKAIEASLSEFLRREKNITHFFAHNIFSHGRHIAAASGIYNALKAAGVKIIAADHDLYWSGSYTKDYGKLRDCVRPYLEEYVPPRSDKIAHLTLNSIAKEALLTVLQKRMPEAEGLPDKIEIMPDVFHFRQKAWKKNDRNRDLLSRATVNVGVKVAPPVAFNDILVLQATRIAARKGIELAVDLVKLLNENKHRLIGRTLYNGKLVTGESRFVLALAGYAEKDGESYRGRLMKKIASDGVPVTDLSGLIGAKREEETSPKDDSFSPFSLFSRLLRLIINFFGIKSRYTLWDCYVFADLVTFPSLWENWGNQFLEAVFAKKPVVVYEYDVYRSDIAIEGYEVISLGATHKKSDGFAVVPKQSLERAAEEVLFWLVDGETERKLAANFALGDELHDISTVETKMRRLLSRTEG